MTLTARRQALVRFAGWLLVAASAVFLVIVARRHWAAISGIAVTPAQWLALAALSLIYGFGLLLVAAGWHAVLSFVGAGSPGRAHSMRAHTTSQLAKYVPGNVFHLVGRHMIHRAAGMADRRLALAALVEILLMLAAALSVVVASLVADMPAVVLPWSGLLLSAVVMLVLGLMVAVWRLGGGAYGHAVVAYLAYFVFFAIMGAIIATIVAMLGGALSWSAGGGGVAAWIAGFVTPGAPGGLGIREAAMVLLGGGGTPAGVLIVTAVLFRLATFAGDLLCFVLGRLLF